MTREPLANTLQSLIAEYGFDPIRETVQALAPQSEQHELTIIANAGGHHLPHEYRRGELFIASEGNLDFSSKDVVFQQYTDILNKLRAKLVEHSWERIHLVPTGHVSLCLQIKLAVYRITRLETVDLFYSNGKYFDLALDIRRLPGLKY